MLYRTIHIAGTRGVWNFERFSFDFASNGPKIVVWAYLGFIFCGLTAILHYITISHKDTKEILKIVEQPADGKTPEAPQPPY